MRERYQDSELIRIPVVRKNSILRPMMALVAMFVFGALAFLPSMAVASVTYVRPNNVTGFPPVSNLYSPNAHNYLLQLSAIHSYLLTLQIVSSSLRHRSTNLAFRPTGLSTPVSTHGVSSSPSPPPNSPPPSRRLRLPVMERGTGISLSGQAGICILAPIISSMA